MSGMTCEGPRNPEYTSAYLNLDAGRHTTPSQDVSLFHRTLFLLQGLSTMLWLPLILAGHFNAWLM